MRKSAMNAQNNQPQTLMEAIKYFAEPSVAHEFVEQMRWPEGVRCIHCDSDMIGHIKSRNAYQCKTCRKQFSIKKGTIFEDSAIGLDKWLCAIWMIANARNGVSSYEVARSIGVTQKTAWFMLQRIRLAMRTGTFEKLAGTVEADETFIGGRARFMHKKRREQKMKGRTGFMGKVIVAGLLARHGEVRTEVMPSTKRKDLNDFIRKNVENGTELHTDALPSYDHLDSDYAHKVIDHAEAYAKGNIHTNGLENYWSLLKRSIKGTYVSVEPFHLFRYLDEQAYRFNNRKKSDSERFMGIVQTISGKRLTYGNLIGNCPAP